MKVPDNTQYWQEGEAGGTLQHGGGAVRSHSRLGEQPCLIKLNTHYPSTRKFHFLIFTQEK